MSQSTSFRIAFMGTPDFSIPSLCALRDAGHQIVAVYCQAPKPAGRGHKLQKVPIQIIAEKLGLPVQTPKTLRNQAEQEKFSNLNLDVAIVAAYGLILPKPILAAPQYGCINIHASLLPRWRGAAPIQRAILAGDNTTGITIMQMDAGLDTGPILMSKSLPITSETTAQSLHNDLANIGAHLIVKALGELRNGTLQPMPQVEDGVTYANKLKREDGKINWQHSAVDIERQIRALNPWPGCFFVVDNEIIKVHSVEIIINQSGIPGTLIDEQFTVACGVGALRLTKVQRPGKNMTDGAALLRGLRLSEKPLL